MNTNVGQLVSIIWGWRRLNPGYPAVFMGPAVQGGAGAVLERLEQIRGIPLLEHQFRDAPRVAVEDLRVALVVAGLADDDRRIPPRRCMTAGAGDSAVIGRRGGSTLQRQK